MKKEKEELTKTNEIKIKKEELIKRDENLYTKINSYYTNFKNNTNSLIDYINELKNTKDDDYISEIKNNKTKEILNIFAKLNEEDYENFYNYVFYTEKNKIIEILNDCNLSSLKSISKRLIDESEEIQIMIINYIIKNNINIIYENICDNKNIMFEILRHNTTLYTFLSENLKKDKEFIIKLLNENKSYISLMDKKYLDEDDIATLVVDKYPENYHYLSLRQKNNHDSAIKALKKVNIYEYLPGALKNDMEFIKEGLKYGNLFKKLNKELRANKEIIMEALKYDEDVIKYIYFPKPEEIEKFFTNDVIEEILSINGLAIKNLSMDVKSNKKFALIAINQNPKSIIHIDKQLYTDYEIVMSALKQEQSLIESIDTIDYNIALKLVQENPNNYNLLKQYKYEYEVMLETLKKDGYKIFMINENDVETSEIYYKLALQAVKQNGKAIKFVSYYCPKYYEICKEAIKQNPYSCKYVNYDYMNIEEKNELELLALTKNALVFNQFDYSSKNNKEYIKIALKQNPELKESLSSEVKYGLGLER